MIQLASAVKDTVRIGSLQYTFTEKTLELFILIGGCYALYTVGMAIATELDYRAINRNRPKFNQRPTISIRTNPNCRH